MSIEPRSRSTSSAVYSRVMPSQRGLFSQSLSRAFGSRASFNFAMRLSPSFLWSGGLSARRVPFGGLRARRSTFQLQKFLIGRQREEVGQFIGKNQFIEDARRARDAVVRFHRGHFLVAQAAIEVGVDDAAVVELRAVMHPLP